MSLGVSLSVCGFLFFVSMWPRDRLVIHPDVPAFTQSMLGYSQHQQEVTDNECMSVLLNVDVLICLFHEKTFKISN